MTDLVGRQAVMWGESMLGFGQYGCADGSGLSGRSFATGLSPRKRDPMIHVMEGFKTRNDVLPRLGRHKHKGSCLYIKGLADIDTEILRWILAQSIASIRKT